jgi:hypothetical protein
MGVRNLMLRPLVHCCWRTTWTNGRTSEAKLNGVVQYKLKGKYTMASNKGMIGWVGWMVKGWTEKI